jgi:hypothetical protein
MLKICLRKKHKSRRKTHNSLLTGLGEKRIKGASQTGDRQMTDRNLIASYLYALNNMSNTRPGALAAMADRMTGDAFDARDYHGFKQPSCDAMMAIEASMFSALCDANGVNWRLLNSHAA